MMGTTSDLKIDGIVRKAYPEELELDTTVPIMLVQHSRTKRSPVHRWLRKKIIDVVVDAKTPTQ